MCPKTVRLIEPSVELEAEFMAMVDESVRAGEHQTWRYEQAIEDFGKYIQERMDWKEGRNLPAGFVSESTFWLICSDNVIVGTSSLRHELTEHLRNIGGHIGYNIRPSERGKGYGTVILALTLEKARELGMDRVLVTCDDNNIASVKIIKRNGGVLEDKYCGDGLKQPKRRYWIEL
jgi:predicted acetyltransferase